MTFTYFIIYSMAIWRIASLLVREAGPWNIFITFREWSGIRHDDGGFPMLVPDNVLAQALSCIWCSSLWVAFFFTIFMYFLPLLSLQMATIFAFSTAAILIDQMIGIK